MVIDVDDDDDVVIEDDADADVDGGDVDDMYGNGVIGGVNWNFSNVIFYIKINENDYNNLI